MTGAGAASLSRRRFLALAALAAAAPSRLRAQAPATPVIYVGHGSPLLAIDPRRSSELQSWAQRSQNPAAS